jgi:hypothetical protein
MVHLMSVSIIICTIRQVFLIDGIFILLCIRQRITSQAMQFFSKILVQIVNIPI